jgi:DNA-binding beta-propeller fold protein YncE
LHSAYAAYGKPILIPNHGAASLGGHDAAPLAQHASIPVVSQPDDVAILPDSSIAFVLSRSQPRLSVVDLRRGVLLANLQLAGTPSDMLLKPDGGELYVISPDSHGLQVINTWTHEVGDYVMLGYAPTRGILSADSSLLYVTDVSASRVTAVGQSTTAASFAPSTTAASCSFLVGQSPDAIRSIPPKTCCSW